MTYEYLCTACGYQWEAEQKITAAPLKRCPECKKDKAQRQVSGGAGFVLKGGGWYADLYSSAKPGAASSADGKSGDSSGESKSSEGKSSEAKASDAKSSEGSSAPKSTEKSASKGAAKSTAKSADS
jgi:putative FmdB family regulatory protein